MTTDLATQEAGAAILEQVVLGGDLSKLTSAQRVAYYREVCRSLRLNPLTKPFSYLNLSGRLVLYANKDCTDQLRKIHHVSIGKPELTDMGEFVSVSVLATDETGRTDSDLGVVMKSDMQRNIANVMKKAITQAKRRVTLSICGLGMLDESEVPDVPGAREIAVDVETGEVLDAEPPEDALSSGKSTKPTTAEAAAQASDPEPREPDKDILIGQIDAGMSKLQLNAHQCVVLAEKFCGTPNWRNAETPDLQLLLAELRRQYIAGQRKK